MPTANDFFPSKYLKAEDLESDLNLTVKNVVIEELASGETKPVMHFNELEKGMIVNKTNWSMIEKITGEKESDNWTGKKVCLTVMDVEFKGDIVSAIRVKAAKDSNPIVQKYWDACTNMKFSTEEGRAHLKEFKGDFAAALAGLTGDDNTPGMEQLPPK